MKTYKYEREYSKDLISVGDKLYINGENIVVVTILQVDFDEGFIWFSGVVSSDLN